MTKLSRGAIIDLSYLFVGYMATFTCKEHLDEFLAWMAQHEDLWTPMFTALPDKEDMNNAVTTFLLAELVCSEKEAEEMEMKHEA